MPRQNVGRTIDSEANLAERIARERRRLGLSYQGLADAMTAVGCSVDRSAMYRVEVGRPRRRISVDELVAFSRVFDRTVDELLVPIELVDQARAQELVARFRRTAEALAAASAETLETLVEYYSIDDRELGWFVAGHIDLTGAEWPPGLQVRLEEAHGVDGARAAMGKVANTLADLFEAATEVARELVAKERSDG